MKLTPEALRVTDTVVPIYQSRNALLVQADARALPLGGETVRLIPTSPPYNVGWLYADYDDDLPLDEYHETLTTVAAECWRVLEPGGTLAINVPPTIRTRTERAYPLAAQLQLDLRAAGWLLAEPIAWVKAGKDGKPLAHSTAFGAPSTPYFRPTYELLIVARKQSFSRQTRQSWPDGFLEMVKDTWVIPPARAPRRGSGDPPPFPDELVRRLVLLFSDPGDVVLDPFVGSGTTVAVAVTEGRIGIGSDRSARSLRAAAERVASAALRIESSERCVICTGPLLGRRRDAATCSDACRQRAYRQRRAS
jgi:modification methylase